MRVYHTAPLADRFWPKVKKTETCWLWTAWRDSRGYGYIGAGGHNGGMLSAHRVAWELAEGPIPVGMHVLHNCPGGDNPSCVRNDEPGFYEIRGILRPRRGHLWLGTNDDNMADAALKGTIRRGAQARAIDQPDSYSHGVDHWTYRHPERRQRGQTHGRSKLTECQVREIRRLRAAGGTLHAIADQFSVSEATVSLIVNRKTWSHLA